MKLIVRTIWCPVALLIAILVMSKSGITGVAHAADGEQATVRAEPTGGPPESRHEVGPDYRLAPHDLVDIEMFNQAEIKASQRLTANGEIRLPLIGRVVLQGLTVREAEQLLEQRFEEEGFFVKPQVIIAVTQYSDRAVAIFGQVRNPERVPLRNEANSIGILEAITLVGGFTRIAKTDAVQVTRTGDDGNRETIEVDVQDLLRNRRPGEQREFQLLAGDVVFVPERAF